MSETKTEEKKEMKINKDFKPGMKEVVYSLFEDMTGFCRSITIDDINKKIQWAKDNFPEYKWKKFWVETQMFGFTVCASRELTEEEKAVQGRFELYQALKAEFESETK